MLSILFVMLLVGLWLRRRRWRRSGATLIALAVLLLFGVGGGVIPRLMVNDLQQAYSTQPKVDWAERNVIILLAGGTSVTARDGLGTSFFANGRVLRAAQMYTECKATGGVCRILVTGGDSQKHGEAESTVYGRDLRRLNIPASDLLFETRSMSTWQNAQFSRTILLEQSPQRIVMVTSAIHLRRSLLYFAHFGIEPQPVAGDWLNTSMEPLPDSWNFLVADAALHEYLGILRYAVYNALGWNAPRAAPLPL